MKENKKIHVAEYLNFLNESVKYAYTYKSLKKESINILSCKELAKKCEVTAATISNLNTSSKFSLIYKIADEIYNAYFSYFLYDEIQCRKEYPNESITPRNQYYIIKELTKWYGEEFQN